MLKIYCMKNNLDGSFYVPFSKYEDPKDLARAFSGMILSDPDKAAQENYHICTIYYLGTFDQDTGKFEIVDPEVVIDLSQPYNQIMKLRGEGHGA